MSYMRAGGFAPLCLVLGLALGGVAWGDKPRVTLHAYEEEGALATADAVEYAVGEVLAGDGRLTFRTIDALLQPGDPARELGVADIQLVDAERAFSGMELDEARKLLEQAIATYQKRLPQLAGRGGGVTPLRDAWLKVSKTRFFDGDGDGARDALRYALTLDPQVTFAKAMFPPSMKKTFVEGRLLFETLGPGKLRLDSDPPGATAYVNGTKLEKPTPTELSDAPPGPLYVSFERRGYAPVTVVAENRGEGETSSLIQSLPRWPTNPFAALDRARTQLDRDRSLHLKVAADALGVELLVLVQTQRAADERLRRVRVVLYDARVDRILGRAERTAAVAEVPIAARALTEDVTRGLRSDGVWQAPPRPVVPRASWWADFSNKTRTDLVRFHHWKYFWYVVGGVAGAVVVSTAVGAGVAAHNRQTAATSVVLFGGH